METSSDPAPIAVTWAEMRMLHRRRAEQAIQAQARRATEAQDRREWIESVRQRLGLVAEVHEYRTWEVGASYWGWACKRRGCRYGGSPQLMPWNFGTSEAAVRRQARQHARRFVPSRPEGIPGASLDLTGFGPASFKNRLASVQDLR